MSPGGRGRLRTALALAPLGLVLGGLFGGALALALAQSLGYAPWFGVDTFPDAAAYRALWGDRAFWASLGLTLHYAVLSTAVAVVLGTALALALARAFPGRRVFGLLYRLPLVVPYAVGIALAIVVMGNGGVASRLAAAFGLIEAPADFPRLLHTHWGWGVVAVYVWKQTPFVAIAVHAVLLGVGRDTEEAAATLGARRWQTVRLVTLPQVMPGIAQAALITFAFNMGAFEAPLILGGGYPDTLPVLAWRLFGDADYRLQVRAMAVVVSIALVSGAVLALHLALAARAARRGGA